MSGHSRKADVSKHRVETGLGQNKFRPGQSRKHTRLKGGKWRAAGSLHSLTCWLRWAGQRAVGPHHSLLPPKTELDFRVRKNFTIKSLCPSIN